MSSSVCGRLDDGGGICDCPYLVGRIVGLYPDKGRGLNSRVCPVARVIKREVFDLQARGGIDPGVMRAGWPGLTVGCAGNPFRTTGDVWMDSISKLLIRNLRIVEPNQHPCSMSKASSESSKNVAHAIPR